MRENAMAAGMTKPLLSLSAAMLLAMLACKALAQGHIENRPQRGEAPAGQVNSIRDVFEKLYGCWKPPPPSRASPMDITVLVSFNRSGVIMGHPKITYESPKASDNDRLVYRVAVMEALQRCSPMPFTEAMAGAVAGHPFTIQFRNHLKTQEKQAWLSPTTH
jgi:hypothetical protein